MRRGYSAAGVTMVTVDQEPAQDEWQQAYLEAGYAWCRPCREYHRPPECAIDEQGVPELDWE